MERLTAHLAREPERLQALEGSLAQSEERNRELAERSAEMELECAPPRHRPQEPPGAREQACRQEGRGCTYRELAPSAN